MEVLGSSLIVSNRSRDEFGFNIRFEFLEVLLWELYFFGSWSISILFKQHRNNSKTRPTITGSVAFSAPLDTSVSTELIVRPSIPHRSFAKNETDKRR